MIVGINAFNKFFKFSNLVLTNFFSQFDRKTKVTIATDTTENGKSR